MALFSVQYLEPGPETSSLSAAEVGAKLRAAFDRLPISLVILGWNLPDALIDACAEECQRAGVKLYRWQPLLTGDGVFMPRPEWQVIGLNGQPVPGYKGLPEFTFVCPNNPEMREAALSHLRDVLQDDRYQGVFLDRIRFPSPVANPESAFGCFCEACRLAALLEELVLEMWQQDISQLLRSPGGAKAFAQALLDPQDTHSHSLAEFLSFRQRNVAYFVRAAMHIARDLRLEVGLDCFSPALTRMVGQGLRLLNFNADWIKVMSYGHTLAPAGVPYELLGLADWLVDRWGVDETEAMQLIAESARLPLPSSRAELRACGLPPEALAVEGQSARAKDVTTLLAGIELVDVPGITNLHPAQIDADARAFREAGADGLALSWDLWRIPLARLDIIRRAWG